MTHDPRLEGDAHSAADTDETPSSAPAASDVPAPAVADASGSPDAPGTTAADTPGTPAPVAASDAPAEGTPTEISDPAPAIPADSADATDAAALADDEDPALRLAAEITRIDEPEDALPPVTLADLPPMMQEAAARAGWTNLMPVQTRALPYIFAKRDLMVQSRTGSGKTGAFLLPLLERLSPDEPAVQALILVPTRELALQVEYEARVLFEGTGLNVAAVYGGVGYGKQMDALRDGAHLVVGTPGRVLDHLLRRTMNLDRIRALVFDEADRMLSIGFYPDMKEIQRYMPKRRISAYLFSATYPPHVLNLAGEFLSEPRMLSLSHQQVHVAQTQHLYCETKPMDKDRALVRIIESENPTAAIIFCNTKANVHYVTAVLQGFGYNADELSADLTQAKREQVLGNLRKGGVRFLVATDVAARGIDIPDLSHVILYEPPEDRESYIHRAGRTGRAGSAGTVISLVDIIQKLELQRIAKHYKIDIQPRPTPDDESVARIAGDRLTALLEARLRARTGLERERQLRYAPLARALAGDDEQLALLAMLLDQYYQESLHAAPPMPATAPAPRQDRRREERRDERRDERREERRDDRRDDRRDARREDRDGRDGRDGHRRDRDRRDERKDERRDERRDERTPVVAATDAPASAEGPEPHAEQREDGQAPREGRRRSRRGRGRKRRRDAEARAAQEGGQAADATQDHADGMMDDADDAWDDGMTIAPVAPEAPKTAPEAPRPRRDARPAKTDAPVASVDGAAEAAPTDKPAKAKPARPARGRTTKAATAAAATETTDAAPGTPDETDETANAKPARGARRGRGKAEATSPEKGKAASAEKAATGGKPRAKAPERDEDEDDGMPLLLEDYLSDDDDRLDDVRGSSASVGSVFGQRLPSGAKAQAQSGQPSQSAPPRGKAAAKPKAAPKAAPAPVQPVLTQALEGSGAFDDEFDDEFDDQPGGNDANDAAPSNAGTPAKRRRRRRRKKPAGASSEGADAGTAHHAEADAE